MDGRKRGSFTTGEPSVKRPRYEEAQQEPGDSEEEIAIHAIYEEDTLGLSSEGGHASKWRTCGPPTRLRCRVPEAVNISTHWLRFCCLFFAIINILICLVAQKR